MMLEQVIIAVATETKSKWEVYARMKNEFYAMYVLDPKEIVRDSIVEQMPELDYVVGIVTIELSPEKLYDMKFLKKKDYELMTGRKAKDINKYLDEMKNKQVKS